MSPELDLPGFRFHPTEEELLNCYLKKAISGEKSHYSIIGRTNIYHYDPWDLPRLATIGEREWYFFVPRDRRQGCGGGRPNRTTENGFWKATGSDRRIVSLSEPKPIIGLRKTLVFYRGRAPRGTKTDWIMNEYRLPDTTSHSKDLVLCKIYRKATSMKVLEQRAATVEETTKAIPVACPSSPLSSMGPISPPSSHREPLIPQASPNRTLEFLKEEKPFMEEKAGEQQQLPPPPTGRASASSIQLPPECQMIPELQMPGKMTMDWTQEAFWNQLGSPWFQNLAHTASILNF